MIALISQMAELASRRRRVASAAAAALLVGGLSVPATAEVFTDDFEADRDFLTEGTSGTGWDTIGSLPTGQDTATINTLDTTTFNGELTLSSNRTNTANPATLTRTVPADTSFRASVRISRNSDFPGNTMATQDFGAVGFHNGGLIARPANEPDGADWVGNTVFRQFFSDYLFRSMQDGSENISDGDISAPNDDGIDLDERLPNFIRLSRLNNTYRASFSNDRENWTRIRGWRPGQPEQYTREDHVGRDIRVGLTQMMFNDNPGINSVFDDFELRTGEEDVDYTRLVVNRTTGRVQIKSEDGINGFDLYRIDSESGSLQPGNWESLQDKDLEGSGPPGDGEGWEQFPESNANRLMEGFLRDQTPVQPGDVINLGKIFDTSGSEDLEFVLRRDGNINQGIIEYIDVLTGDMNDDGQVNNLDINPFVLALTDEEAFEQQFGVDPAQVGDTNGDGQFNNLDINPFVELLTGGSGLRAVPEPASLGMLWLGGMLLLGNRRRRRAR